MTEPDFRKLIWKIIKISALTILLLIVLSAILREISVIRIPCEGICSPERGVVYPTINKISVILYYIIVIPTIPLGKFFASSTNTNLFQGISITTYVIIFLIHSINLLVLSYVAILIGKLYYYLIGKKTL